MKRMLILLILPVFLLASCSTPEKNVKENTPKEVNESIQKDADDSAQKEAKESIPKVQIGLSVGKMAPDFTLKDIDGKDVSLSDYKGKTVLVNFFGVWCPWCMKEMPGFMNVYKDYKDKGLELLVVDVGDTKETVIDYLKENNYNIKPVMDDNQEVTDLYRVNGFPTSYIIDENGIILKVHMGYMEEGLLRTFLGTVIK